MTIRAEKCYNTDTPLNGEVTILDEAHALIAEINPFRYRSYYYDTETNLYYLNTRYYDPETGRFILNAMVYFGVGLGGNGFNGDHSRICY